MVGAGAMADTGVRRQKHPAEAWDETCAETCADDRTIDLVHLARMTMGDRAIEREVLQLFARQSALLMVRMEAADPASVGSAAHTLRGSAQGLGAWKVARAAQAVERAGSAQERGEALVVLRAAVTDAQSAIAELLQLG